MYVDDMRVNARVLGRAARWSHLLADTHEELEEFARRLGLRPAWIQRPGTVFEHYDVTDEKRRLAIRLGAHAIRLRDSAEIVDAKRDGRPPALPEETLL